MDVSGKWWKNGAGWDILIFKVSRPAGCPEHEAVWADQAGNIWITNRLAMKR